MKLRHITAHISTVDAHPTEGGFSACHHGPKRSVRFTAAFSYPAPLLCRERSQECLGQETKFESKSAQEAFCCNCIINSSQSEAAFPGQVPTEVERGRETSIAKPVEYTLPQVPALGTLIGPKISSLWRSDTDICM